jgi:hypothetical protein
LSRTTLSLQPSFLETETSKAEFTLTLAQTTSHLLLSSSLMLLLAVSISISKRSLLAREAMGRMSISEISGLLVSKYRRSQAQLSSQRCLRESMETFLREARDGNSSMPAQESSMDGTLSLPILPTLLSSQQLRKILSQLLTLRELIAF